MKLDNIEQIKAPFLIEYRQSLDLSLEKFWGAIGINAVRGFRYETGVTKIPETVKRLIFLQHSVGIPTDCTGDEFAYFLATLRNSNPFKVGQAAKLMKEAQQLLTGDDK